MMNTDYSRYLAELSAQQTCNIASYTLQNQETIWIRKASRHNAAWRYALLGMITRPLKLGALQPVPSLGGEHAIDVEATRLRTLYDAGIAVPQVLAQQTDALMMSSLSGVPLHQQIEHEAAQGCLNAWETGLLALAEVHHRQQFLSQAFARNIMIDKDKISFLDFEDNPANVLNLEQCQSRDWLCYLHSTAHTLQQAQLLPQAAAIWHTLFTAQNPNVQKWVKQSVRPIGWARHLRATRWGRDMLRIAAVAELFFQAESC